MINHVNLTTLADFKGCAIPPIGSIPSHLLFPIIGEDDGVYLHSDGSVFAFFKVDFKIRDILTMIGALPAGVSMQLYRLKTSGGIQYYCSLRVEIEYFPEFAVKEILLANPLKIGNGYADIATQKFAAAKQLLKKTQPQSFTECSFHDNPLLSYLVDYTDSPFLQAFICRSNVSTLLTGQNSHGTVLSINNIDSIPFKSSILKDIDFVQVYTIVNPTVNQLKQIHQSVETNASILGKMSHNKKKDKTSAARLDTLVHEDIKELWQKFNGPQYFIDSSFFISGSSIAALKDSVKIMAMAFSEIDVILFQHSNTSRNQYVSLFPGNSIYGEHWYLAFPHFAGMITSRLFEL